MPVHSDDLPDRARAQEIHLAWLLRLRWAAVAGALAAAALAGLGADAALPLAPLLALAALLAASNLAVFGWRRARPSRSPRPVAGLLLLDILLLAALLHLTGGPTNPFSAVLLVQVTLSAVMLPASWTALLTSLAVTAFGVLFLVHPLPDAPSHGGSPASSYGLHLYGMWVAFTVAAVLIAVFVSRVSGALRRQELALAAAREREARSEHLASLATLAAGTAHELATPLATIAVSAGELERGLARGMAPAEAREEARLIRGEVDRCRAILEQLSTDAGQNPMEAFEPVRPEPLFADVRDLLPRESAARVRFEDRTGGEGALPFQAFQAPRKALARAVANLVRNGLDASGPDAPVEVCVHREAGHGASPRAAGREAHHGAHRETDRIVLTVRDRGHGMSPAVAARAGEPFFTTKPPGAGQGLGLFLVRALAEQLGGRLHLASGEAEGTAARLELPARPPAPTQPPGSRPSLAPASSGSSAPPLPTIRAREARP